jgi:hypothetical protein
VVGNVPDIFVGLLYRFKGKTGQINGWNQDKVGMNQSKI